MLLLLQLKTNYCHTSIEMACVSGSGQPAPYGMIVLSEAAREECKNPERKSSLTEELDAHRKLVNSQLDHHEALKTLVVMAEEWTIDNGNLTPTMKLKRNSIEDNVAKFVDDWYSQNKSVIWQ